MFEAIGNLTLSGYIVVTLIFIVFIVAIVISLRIKQRYEVLTDCIGQGQQEDSYEYKFVQALIKEYKKTLERGVQVVNTQATIERFLDKLYADLLTAERFVKHATSLLIIMGLLGTFMGLTSAVGELSKLIDFASNDEVLEIINSIGGGLASSLRGMGVAFITSLFGIGTSLLLTVINVFLKPLQARFEFMTAMEEFLDHYIAPQIVQEKNEEFRRLGDSLTKSLKEFGENVTQALGQAAHKVGQSSTDLSSGVQQFDASLQQFSKNIGDFSEFNVNLRNNISRMDVNFIKLTDALQELAQTEKQVRGR